MKQPFFTKEDADHVITRGNDNYVLCFELDRANAKVAPLVEMSDVLSGDIVKLRDLIYELEAALERIRDRAVDIADASDIASKALKGAK